MKYAAIGALGASLVMGACATAQSEDMFMPEGYELTGESRTCLSLRSIDQIDTASETAWVVTTTTRDTYLTRVSRGCSAATRPFNYISYNVTGSQLCRGEIVRVIDRNTNSTVGSCGIGEFEELTPSPTDAS
ncbi:hypothetical protein [Oceanicaulis sp. MMSF_3324]|uniref:hypothetical protein n=1 Tax=Oceanicaulis sp. MMSF_3324 TaxID=3046702 RepID=UPI00273E0433|nr:hypothetical protein [Oceanicaulis sp. MMSF_3324]